MNASDFKQIFLPCHRRMYTAAWRLTGNQQEAEDLVQDAMMRLWIKRKNIEKPDNAEAFAVTTLRNLFYDQHRKKQLKQNDEEPKDHQLRTEHDASDALAVKQEMMMTQQCINDLPENQRLIITLHDIDELSYEEIEKQTGLNAVNIRVTLSRARKAVREKLQAIRQQ
ncbi:RNA polymerase sigma factor [Hallella colorans]|uniref:RNA polymerase sigma factor n=1 Tax=Hallella colorans TaxID=1703337 RepID=UPI0023F031BE|nr:RNA polymerase sigma factor [Hallella colorans]